MNILEALYAEGIDFDRCPIRENLEYQKMQKTQSERAERFMSTLTREQIKAMIELEREENKLRFLEEQSNFVVNFLFTFL